MFDELYLFVGPYAEWRVPTKPPKFFSADFDMDSLQPNPQRRALVWNVDTNDNNNLTVVVERKRYYRFCCMPCKKREGQPNREMLFEFSFIENYGPPFMAEDWCAINRRAEVKWFRKAFAEELQQFAKQIGSKPTFHWGLVHWYTG